MVVTMKRTSSLLWLRDWEKIQWRNSWQSKELLQAIIAFVFGVSIDDVEAARAISDEYFLQTIVLLRLDGKQCPLCEGKNHNCKMCLGKNQPTHLSRKLLLAASGQMAPCYLYCHFSGDGCTPGVENGCTAYQPFLDQKLAA